MTGYCCLFKFLRRGVDGKHFVRLQSENGVFKFLRRSVDKARISLLVHHLRSCEKMGGDG